MDERPLCIDLFCGYGGWARGFLDAGYRVIGFDNEPKCARKYPGEFVLADVRILDGRQFRDATVIVASPPCTEFSGLAPLRKAVHGIEARPWDGNGIGLVHEGLRIIYEAEPHYWIVENVRGAERYIGRPTGRSGRHSLWGHYPPFIAAVPSRGVIRSWKWERNGRRGDPHDSRRRAIIPYPLARALAEACLPDGVHTAPDEQRAHREDAPPPSDGGGDEQT